ncbi:MAG: ribosome assembly factor SBDS [Candidatus Hodarchaeales archaeon]|jgi:ribosome maturation protein SDO1
MMHGAGARGEKRVDLSGKAIVRLKTHGERFEIIVNPDLAYKYRVGEIKEDDEIDLLDILETDAVFTNASKGERAGIDTLALIFDTEDFEIIAERILKTGELQLTASQREKMTEQKRKQIVAFIIRNCVDPKTKLPHPPTRIENAMAQIRVGIDPFAPAEAQALEVVRAIRSILPIRMEQVKMALKIPGEFSGKAYGIVKREATIVRDDWGSDGSWIVMITLAAGLQASFLEKIGNLCRGREEVKILERTKLG